MNFYKDTAPTVVTNNGDKVGINDIAVNSKVIPNLVDSGAKNELGPLPDLELLKSYNSQSGYVWNNNSVTYNGVTYTIDSDGIISLSGTSSSTMSYLTLFDYGSSGVTKFSGKVLSGCCADGNYASKYALYAVKPDGNTAISNENEQGVIIPNNSIRYIRILVRPNVNVNGLVFKPMICSKAAWDVSHQYVPYRPSLETLYSKYPITVQNNASFSAANTWTYTGVTAVIPADKICLVVASMNYNVGKPLGICICNNIDPTKAGVVANTLAYFETTEEDMKMMVPTCMFVNPNVYSGGYRLYVHAKNSSTIGASSVRLSMIYLN